MNYRVNPVPERGWRKMEKKRENRLDRIFTRKRKEEAVHGNDYK